MKKIIVFIISVFVMSCLAGCGSKEPIEYEDEAKKWDCTVLCAEESEDTYVITYSNEKVISDTGILSVQNRNSFDIVVHLLADDQEERTSEIMAGGCSVLYGISKGTEYAVGCHANVKEGTEIKLMVYDGEETEPYSITTAYAYPVVPETDEWKELNSLDEKVAVCQIPEDLLYKMCTDALVETVVNCPIIVNMFAHNTVEFGYNQVKGYFNGLNELSTRSDAIDELKVYLKEIDSSDIISAHIIETLIEQIGKEKTGWSIQEIEALFLDNAEPEWKLIKCVSVYDFAYDRVGVVLYTTKNDTEYVNIAFMDEEGIMPQCGIEAFLDENTEFTYHGNGEVTFNVCSKDGVKYKQKIVFSKHDDEVNFVSESMEY